MDTKTDRLTRRERLDQQIMVINALRHAITRLREAGPAGRSKQAAAEHDSRIARLKGVMDEVDQIAQSIADQG
jgi:hypothetical protein